MKIEAWKSEFTGELFEFEKDYKKHISSEKRLLKAKEKEAQKKLAREQWWHDNFYNRVRSMAQLQAALKLHIKHIMKDAITNSFFISAPAAAKKLAIIDKEDIVIKFDRFDMQYSDKASNSHRCPVGGVTNWHREKDKPLAYPGFVGRIGFDIKSSIDISGSILFESTRLYSGTGGDGDHGYSYEFTIFLDDWPALKTAVEETVTYMKLTDTPSRIGGVLNKIYTEYDYKLLVGDENND